MIENAVSVEIVEVEEGDCERRRVNSEVGCGERPRQAGPEALKGLTRVKVSDVMFCFHMLLHAVSSSLVRLWERRKAGHILGFTLGVGFFMADAAMCTSL